MPRRVRERCQGREAESLAEATALEAAVGRALARAGVAAVSQNAQNPRAAGGTPDFLLPAGTRINGAEVRWIEAKNFYGMGAIAGTKPWLPVRKAEAQLARYRAHFGTGAVLMVCGASRAFVAKLPPGVILLDASNIEDDLWPPPPC